MRIENFTDLQQYIKPNKDKRTVFDASDISIFRVLPEDSSLGVSEKVKRELTEKYLYLTCFLGCVVDGAIIIQDLLPYANRFDLQTAEKFFETTRNLNKASNITLQVVDAGTLTYFLFKMIGKPIIKSLNPLCVFPGEGAKTMNQYIKGFDPSYKLPSEVSLPCQRIYRDKGKFDINVDFSPLPKSLDTGTVIIFDDVVASGQTVQTVARGIKEKYGNVRVVAATWLFLNPTTPESKASRSGIQDVDFTIASFALKGNYTSRPPINSLSCFIKSSGKYDEVKRGFMQKYIIDQGQFMNNIEAIRQGMVLKEK